MAGFVILEIEEVSEVIKDGERRSLGDGGLDLARARASSREQRRSLADGGLERDVGAVVSVDLALNLGLGGCERLERDVEATRRRRGTPEGA